MELIIFGIGIILGAIMAFVILFIIAAGRDE